MGVEGVGDGEGVGVGVGVGVGGPGCGRRGGGGGGSINISSCSCCCVFCLFAVVLFFPSSAIHQLISLDQCFQIQYSIVPCVVWLVYMAER